MNVKRIPQDDTAAMNATYPLSMAAEGAHVRVLFLRGGNALIRRLTDMGLNPGATLTLLHHQGGAVVVLRGETRFAIGSGMAHQILVSDAADPSAP